MELKTSAFEMVYGSHLQRIRKLVVRFLGENDVDVDDVIQKIFLKVHDALPSLLKLSSITVWIKKVAESVVIDHMRSRRAHKNQEHILGGSCDGEAEKDIDAPDLERLVIRYEMISCIREYISKLPEKYRTALVLSYFEGLSTVEISERLNLSVEAVKIRLHRARAKLRVKLEAGCAMYRDEQNDFVCSRKDCSFS